MRQPNPFLAALGLLCVGVLGLIDAINKPFLGTPYKAMTNRQRALHCDITRRGELVAQGYPWRYIFRGNALARGTVYPYQNRMYSDVDIREIPDGKKVGVGECL